MQAPLFLLGAWAAFASAQTASPASPITSTPITSLQPAQSLQIQTALLSYASSVRSSPQITGIGFALVFAGVAVNEANIGALNPVPTSQNVDWLSFANTPPSITSQPTWFSTINTGLQSSITSLQTSVLNEAVNIARAQLGEPRTTLPGLVSPTASGSGASGTNAASPARMGAAEGALGVAAVGFGLLAVVL